MEKQNLLIPLHNLAGSNDEDFLTEIFAFLLRYFLEHEHDAAISLIKYISGGVLSLSRNDLSSVDVSTRTVTTEGIPDLEIKTRKFLLFVEVKVDSNFGHKQLERYRRFLDSSGLETALVTLTRYHHKFHKSDIEPDYGFRWHNLADWLSRFHLKQKTSRFITKQFLGLLRHRGVTMEKITWQLIDGIRSLKDLIDMIGEALLGENVPIHSKSPAWNWMGYYLEDKKFFVGVYFDNPNLIVLNTEASLRDDRPDEPDIGKYEDDCWQNELDMSSESIHFFARSKPSQISCLKTFIKESISYGKSLIKT